MYVVRFVRSVRKCAGGGQKSPKPFFALSSLSARCILLQALFCVVGSTGLTGLPDLKNSHFFHLTTKHTRLPGFEKPRLTPVILLSGALLYSQLTGHPAPYTHL